MASPQVERRLRDVGARLAKLRGELAVTDEQLGQLTDEADDARLRALVSETPLAEKEHREAHRHADVMSRHRSELLAEIDRLERSQDDLLDRLTNG